MLVDLIPQRGFNLRKYAKRKRPIANTVQNSNGANQEAVQISSGANVEVVQNSNGADDEAVQISSGANVEVVQNSNGADDEAVQISSVVDEDASDGELPDIRLEFNKTAVPKLLKCTRDKIAQNQQRKRKKRNGI